MRSFAEGKSVLITGATDGIGKATAVQLAQLGARVIVHGRDERRLRETRDWIQDRTGRQLPDGVVADFASLDQVRGMADELRARAPDLRILINNAGVYSSQRRLTGDGFELTLQVNYLAPFLLTTRLKDLLQENEPARIINVTSTLHIGAELDPADLQSQASYDGVRAYSTSKLALSLFTVELAERLSGSGVAVFHLHPGGVSTKLLHAGFGPGGISPEEGAKTSVLLASSPGIERQSGSYFVRESEARPDPRVFEPDLRQRLWNETERLLGKQEARSA